MKKRDSNTRQQTFLLTHIDPPNTHTIMTTTKFTILSILIISTLSRECKREPIDLNTASRWEIAGLPYVGFWRSYWIVDFRPICSPLELANPSSAKKIKGITEYRVNKRWKWYEDQSCEDSCCLAYASCSTTSTTTTSPTMTTTQANTPTDDNTNTPSPITTTTINPTQSPTFNYQYVIGEWDDCTAECGGGTQMRSVECSDGTNIVANAYCINTISDENTTAIPRNKRTCNNQNCPNYQWVSSEWDVCAVDITGEQCLRSRSVNCWELESDTLALNENECDSNVKPLESMDCDEFLCFGDTSGEIKIEDVTIRIDLRRSINEQRCNTDLFYDRMEFNNTFIVRRGCEVNGFIDVVGLNDGDVVDGSWFGIDAVFENEVDVGDTWTTQYLSYQSTTPHSGELFLNIGENESVGVFMGSLLFYLYGNHSQSKAV